VDVRSLAGKTALVTGAASGIGKATAIAFAERGADLFLCDLNEAGLKETEAMARALGRRAWIRRVDVSRRDEVEAFAREVHSQVEAVDILMNNAGVGLGASFQESLLEDWDWIVGINLFGVVHGLHFFVPPMVRRARGGHVVNVSSAAGYIAAETLCAYSTTKFAVLGLSEALRAELAPHGIGVTAICPGIINTPIVQSSRYRGRAADPELLRQAADFYRRRNYGPERVARNVLRAIQRNRRVAPVSPEAWAMYLAKRFAPNTTYALLGWMSQRAQRRAAATAPPAA
jgi:NAD(P)-dependent dehydrogenase (short-subunit alcohol dehydrogenase family)